MRFFVPTARALAFVFLIASGAALQAEPRTFTSPDGRTLQGEVVSATPDMVTLQLVNGPQLAVAINKFSEPDKAFIAEWRKANPVTIKYNFDLSFTKEKTDSSKSSRGNTEVITDVWVCNLKLANRSNQTLENIKVDYEVFYSQAGGNGSIVRKMPGNLSVPILKHLEQTTVKTKEVRLETTKLEGGYYYLDGSRSRQKDAIEGVIVKISHAGKPAFEWVSPGVPANRGAATERR